MQIAIFLMCCAILGMLAVICFYLRDIRYEVNSIRRRYEVYSQCTIDWLDQLFQSIPDTFEYNGNKGKVYRK